MTTCACVSSVLGCPWFIGVRMGIASVSTSLIQPLLQAAHTTFTFKLSERLLPNGLTVSSPVARDFNSRIGTNRSRLFCAGFRRREIQSGQRCSPVSLVDGQNRQCRTV